MAVLMTLESTGGTTAQYDRTNEILGVSGESSAPAGLISHTCGTTADGLIVVDVWDSLESLDSFAHDRLGAAMAEAGMPQATPNVRPVHYLSRGTGTEANVIVLIETPGFTTDAYDAVMAKMPSHAGSGENHPAFMHVAAVGTTGDVFVADLWDSAESFGEFARTEIGPAMGGEHRRSSLAWSRALQPLRRPGGLTGRPLHANAGRAEREARERAWHAARARDRCVERVG